MGNGFASSRRINWVPWIFHLVLWTIWIGLPIVNSGDHDAFRTFSIWLIPVHLTNIPLFFLNTHWAIPQLLRKRGVPAYLLSLLLLIAVFGGIHFYMKEWIIPAEVRFNRNDWFWSITPVSFVTAISTGYGFIQYLLQQEREKSQRGQEQLQAELSFLRSQISPHFLFNILNSIVYLIRTRSPQAESVTLQLSELMRYMLYQEPGEQVALHRELSYLRNYIELQRIRFAEDVDIQFVVEEGGPDLRIEPMLLIPFVENAFKHGVGLLQDPLIDIRVECGQASLDFRVRNKVAPESREDKDFSSGIGLRNVQRRLELIYPQQHELNIVEQGGYFEVQLHLQLHTIAQPESAQAIPM